MATDYRKLYAIQKKNEQKLLQINPTLNNRSGIYFLTRTDEEGIKYAYIGQAKHILNRIAQHLVGYQHIDLSLKKHGLYCVDNQHGWKIGFMNFQENVLDEKEIYYIKQYANAGYQLRNKTGGSQGEGKRQIDEYRPAKGYRDGIAQGRKSLAKELSDIIDKHLVVSIKPDKMNNKISQKQFEKFKELLSLKNE